MFDLFLALFGGAYYISKIKQDKRSTKDYDNHHKSSKNLRANVCCSAHEDLNLRSMLRDPAQKEDILSFVSSDLSNIYGCNWRKKLKRLIYSWVIGATVVTLGYGTSFFCCIVRKRCINPHLIMTMCFYLIQVTT